MSTKTALITGITGQDGYYLAELLLQKGYTVHGIRRRTSLPNTQRIDALLEEFGGTRFFLHAGDLSDSGSLYRILQNIMPDEIYNLAALSDVAISFETPEYTAEVNALGTLRLLEGMRLLGLEKKSRFYQASTSELFGKVRQTPQTEKTPFYPRSPYAISKLYAYWITVNYRESYGMFACNGILFNHESPMRGENFVTRKITRGLTRAFLGLQKTLSLGNLDAKRDWGHTRDFVEMQWRILQQERPDDFVIATGEEHTVRFFVERVAFELGITLSWEGEGMEEKGIVARVDSTLEHALFPGQPLIEINPQFFRPAEVERLCGDASKAHTLLGWKPRITFEEMVSEMTREDLKLAEQEAISYERNLH